MERIVHNMKSFFPPALSERMHESPQDFFPLKEFSGIYPENNSQLSSVPAQTSKEPTVVLKIHNHKFFLPNLFWILSPLPYLFICDSGDWIQGLHIKLYPQSFYFSFLRESHKFAKLPKLGSICNPPASASHWARITGMCHQTQLN